MNATTKLECSTVRSPWTCYLQWRGPVFAVHLAIECIVDVHRTSLTAIKNLEGSPFKLIVKVCKRLEEPRTVQEAVLDQYLRNFTERRVAATRWKPFTSYSRKNFTLVAFYSSRALDWRFQPGVLVKGKQKNRGK